MQKKIVLTLSLIIVSGAVFAFSTLSPDSQNEPVTGSTENEKVATENIGAENGSESKSDNVEFNYESYGRVLQTYVNDKGRVNYSALKKDSADLKNFLGQIARLDRGTFNSWSKKEKLAFYINAYNAITLQAILNNYPIQRASGLLARRFPQNSIRQIDGVWDKLRWSVIGKRITLNTIEHEILRKQFNEPRIHMSIVCASIGCPLLLNEPFQAETLEAQMDGQAKKFLATASKFSLDRRSAKATISPIFDWFGDDFIRNYGKGSTDKEKAVLNFISKYVSDSDAQYLRTNKIRVSHSDYDWSLNEQ